MALPLALLGLKSFMPSVKTIVIGLAALFIVSIVAAGYWHYTSLVAQVATLTADNTTLKSAVKTQAETIKEAQGAIGEWKEAQAELQRRFEELQRVAEAAGSETRRLNELFAQHNLGQLGRAKPALVQRRLNSGTDAARRMLECASGARGADCPGQAGSP